MNSVKAIFDNKDYFFLHIRDYKKNHNFRMVNYRLEIE